MSQHSKVKAFSSSTEIRAIARERVGTVPGRRVFIPKPFRKTKHKKDWSGE